MCVEGAAAKPRGIWLSSGSSWWGQVRPVGRHGSRQDASASGACNG